MPKPNKELADAMLVNILISPDVCPYDDCDNDMLNMGLMLDETEAKDTELMFFKCDCPVCGREWIEVYRFVGIKIGTAFGELHDEAWVIEKETIFVSVVNQELLAAVRKSLEILENLGSDYIADKLKDPHDEFINYLKELIDKAKGVDIATKKED